VPTDILPAKLGLKPGMTACAIDRPKGLADLLPFDTSAEPTDVTIAFVRSPDDVAACIDTLLARFRSGDRLWFAYPKKSGRVPATITRDTGWDALVAHDWLPVTQIAIDTDWSALRFRPRSEIGKLTRKQDMPGHK
jgi:hypothetical protein